MAWRVLGVIAGVLWGIMGVALLVVGIDVLGIPLCSDPEALAEAVTGGECYDGSSTQRTFDVLFAIPAGVLGLVTLVVSIYHAATGRGSKLLLIAGGAALLLFCGSLLIGGL